MIQVRSQEGSNTASSKAYEGHQPTQRELRVTAATPNAHPIF